MLPIAILCTIMMAPPRGEAVDEARRMEGVREALHQGDDAVATALAAGLPSEGSNAPRALRLRAWAALRAHDHAALSALLAPFGPLSAELQYVLGASRWHAQGNPDALQNLWASEPDTLWGMGALRQLALGRPSKGRGAATAPVLYHAAECAVIAREAPVVAPLGEGAPSDLSGALRQLSAAAPLGGRLAAEATYGQGVAALHRQALEDARTALVKALHLLPLSAPLRPAVALALGETERRSGDYRAAMVHFDRAARGGGEVARLAQLRAGEMACEFHHYDEAQRRFEAMLRAEPAGTGRADALWGLGWVAFRSGNFRQARSTFATLVAEQPFGPHTAAGMYWHGRAREELGDHAGAQQQFRAILQRFPVDYYAYRATSKLAREEYLPGAISADRDSRVTYVQTLLRAGMARLARDALLRLASSGEFVTLGPDALEAIAALATQVGMRPLAQRARERRCQQFFDGSEACRNAVDVAPLSPYRDVLARAARLNAIDPALVLAVAQTESQFEPAAVSPAGALGLMQLMPRTAQGLWLEDHPGPPAATADLLDPNNNARLGARYLARLLRSFGHREEIALATYNAGSDVVMRWLQARGELPADIFVEEIPFKETRSYVKRVLAGRLLARRLQPL